MTQPGQDEKPAKATVDRGAMDAYFKALWPDPEGTPGQLVLVTFKRKMPRIRWTSIQDAAAGAANATVDGNVYVTVQTHDKSASARAWLKENPAKGHPDDGKHRGSETSAVAIPGAWIDIDTLEGVHKKQNLPTKAEALALLDSLRLKPTLIVDSGGGLHPYWLTREPWIFGTEQERQSAHDLLDGFERVISARFRERGWHLDTVADLARILRVPGTINHKGTPVPVRILSLDDSRRINPSDLEEFIAEAPPESEASSAEPGPPSDEGELPDAQRVFAGCGWLASLRDAPQTQTEPQWYGALGILGRCRDGVSVAREFSKGYPGYSEAETDQKTAQAIAKAGPRTCNSIRTDLGGAPFCALCSSFGQITSPIQLGYGDPAAEALATLKAALEAGGKEQLLAKPTLNAI